jgi:hypothetical protein
MSEWISVKEKLPEDERFVLAWQKGHMPPCVTFFSHFSFRWMTPGITHWASITAPENEYACL